MYFAIISTDGDVLEFIDDLGEAYAALDNTPDADLVAFVRGVPQPPPVRNQHAVYGEPVRGPSFALSGDLRHENAPLTLAA